MSKQTEMKEMTETTAKPANNNTAPYWSLKGKNKEFVAVSLNNGDTAIRCLWTTPSGEKKGLGLQMNHQFDTKTKAEEFIPVIHARGRVAIEHWTKVFQADETFLQEEGYNPDLIPS